jgi:LacI family transcriptional regulator
VDQNTSTALPKRVTLADIARVAQVSIGTVSLCLNNNKRAAKKTRERIQEIARRLGYREDPALSALVAYRTRKRTHRDYEVIAFLSGWNPEDPQRSTLSHRSCAVAPAAARAQRFGYELREFWIPPGAEQQRQLGRRLYQMGIRGVLLAGTPHDEAPPDMPWDEFATVVLGRSNAPSELDRCAANFNQGMALLVSHLRNSGCNRLGIASTRSHLSWTSYEKPAGLLRAWYIDGCEFHLVEPFIADGRSMEIAALATWMRTNKVDGVMTDDPGLAFQAIKRLGPSASDSIRVAGWELSHGSPYSGIVTPDAQVAEAAVDRLRSKLLSREWGVPEVRTMVSINCQWCPDGR